MSLTADKYRTTVEDLEWFKQQMAREDLKWIFASTMKDTPHHYIVHPKVKGFDRPDYERAARVIRTFGQPGKFFGQTRIYLIDEEAGYRFWTADERVEDTDLINRAPLEQSYGPQNAPVTETGKHTFYDTLASEYDRLWTNPSDIKENIQVKRLILDLFPNYAPSILDIGCGTGLLLDIGVASPRIYTGVDPSRGMLNHLVRKHPNVSKLIAATAEDVLLSDRRNELKFPYELVTATFASASYLTDDALEAMIFASKGKVIQMVYEEGYVPQYYAETGEPIPDTVETSRKKVFELVKEYNGRIFKIGQFHTAVINGQAKAR